MAGITKEEQKRRAELLVRGLKVCNECGRELPVEQFHKDKNRKDGLQPKCKDCVDINNKQYRQKNKEKLQQYMKQYNKQYRQTPQGQIALFNAYAKRQRKEEQGAGITKEQWLEMMQFFDFKCAYSGINIGGKCKNRTIDHITAIANGGEHEVWNCVPMDKSLNTSKRDKDMLEWYTVQDFYDEERLDKINEWQQYAYNKWSNQEQNIKIKEI